MIFKSLLSLFKKYKEKLEIPFIVLFFLIVSGFYLYPIFQGLIVLPLDLLISNYLPWYSPGTILLKNNYMQDSIVQMYPWRHLVFESLTNGFIPFWNPFQFMGAPFLASMKPLVFYPTNIFFVLGEGMSWNFLLFSQIFLSFFFFYLLSRDFNLPRLASILSSFAFGLSSLMIGVLQFGSEGHVILWIPLFLLFSKRYIDGGSGKNLFFLSITIALSIFAGQLQYSGYGLILLTFFIFFYGYHKKANMRVYLTLFLAIFLGVGLTSVVLLPAFELFRNSHRGLINSENIFKDGLANPLLLLRLFASDFFGSPVTRNLAVGYIETSGYFGIVPLFFAIFAAVFSRKNIFVKFFTFVFILGILFSLKYIGDLIYLLRIPLITSGSGGRIFMLVLFSGAALCGFGLIEFIKNNNSKRLLLSLIAFVSLFVFVAVFKILALDNQDLVSEFIHNIKFSIISISAFSFIVVIYLIFRNKIKIAGILFMLLVIAISFTELFIFGYRFLTFSNTKFLYPKTGVSEFVKDFSKDTLARSHGLTEPEISTYLNTYSAETYNPLYLEDSAISLQFLQLKQNEKLTEDNKYFLTKQERLKEVLDFLGVSLIVGNKDGNPSIDLFLTGKYQNSFNDIYKDEKFKVYLSKDAFPRFYLVYDYEVLNEKDTLLTLSKPLNPLREKVILSKNISLKLNKGTGSATLIKSNINYQKFKVNTSQNAIFYISDTFYPGWSVKVNGEYTKILKANYNFKAVVVPKGESLVEFNYLPTNFNLAIFLSMLSLVGLILASIKFGKFKKQK